MLESWNIGEKTCITNHREVLIRDVADKTTNKNVNLQTFTLIDMASQDLANIFKNNRSDPPFVLSYEMDPMHSKFGRNMITDMSCGAQHNLYLE